MDEIQYLTISDLLGQTELNALNQKLSDLEMLAANASSSSRRKRLESEIKETRRKIDVIKRINGIRVNPAQGSSVSKNKRLFTTQPHLVDHDTRILLPPPLPPSLCLKFPSVRQAEDLRVSCPWPAFLARSWHLRRCCPPHREYGL
jgi:hypothetical protein